MHYRVLAIVDEDKTIEGLMAPYGDGLHWDFYQIGGRFTGHFDGYDPHTDPANVETCNLCRGTGERPGGREEFGEAWYKQMNGCNGCKGKGTRLSWPTKWPERDGDKVSVADLTDKHYDDVHAMVCECGWFKCERYEPWQDQGGRFVRQSLPTLAWIKETHPNATAIVVDIHN